MGKSELNKDFTKTNKLYPRRCCNASIKKAPLYPKVYNDAFKALYLLAL